MKYEINRRQNALGRRSRVFVEMIDKDVMGKWSAASFTGQKIDGLWRFQPLTHAVRSTDKIGSVGSRPFRENAFEQHDEAHVQHRVDAEGKVWSGPLALLTLLEKTISHSRLRFVFLSSGLEFFFLTSKDVTSLLCLASCLQLIKILVESLCPCYLVRVTNWV